MSRSLYASMPACARALRSSLAATTVHLEHGKEGLLRDLHCADLLHALLALLLLLEQLALAGDVAAVQLRRHVLAQRLDRLPGDHVGADRRLDRDVEELPGDGLPEALDQRPAPLVCGFPVDDQ